MQYGQPSESSQTVRERVVMMWEARNLVENCPEVKEVSRKFGNYLTPTEYSATTGDRDYNATVNEWFHSWCKQADATGRNSFRKLVQLAAENRPVDGDCGFVIRRVGDGLKLQLVPATRIGNPNEMGLDSENYFEGVITNEFGVPVAYRIYRVTREGVYFGAEDVPAGNFCHYFDPFRVDQYRGVTDFHAAIQTARMLHEILQAEKAGVRFASQQAALVFTDRGTANARNLFTPTPAMTLPSGQQQKNELSEVGMIKYLGQADRVETMPARPSTAFTGFIAHLMHELSIAVGIPKGVLFGTQDYAGPSVRAEFAAADRVFARHQGVLVDKVLDPIKNAVILDAIARGEIPAPPVRAGETPVQTLKRATRGEWRFPPKLTIDVGRESAANMNENRQGAKSLQEIAAEQGTDAFTRLEQIAAEASYVGELAKRYGIPETAIRMVTQQLPANPSMAAALGTSVTEDAVDAVNATTGKAAAPEQAAPVAPTETINASADLITINFAEDSYVPNDAMAANARRALEVRAAKPPSQRGMTAVGLARARDIQNKKALSEETVRRMKAYFDRHEIDKQGQTWAQQGKGWQAWHGWGGDAGQTWANAIVERLNKQRQQNSAPAENRVEFSAATEVQLALKQKPTDANDWLTAVAQYRKELDQRSAAHVAPVLMGKSVGQLLEPKKFDLPTPNAGENHEDFMARCMADPVATAEFPDAAQRTAVCMRQHPRDMAKVGPSGAIVSSDKAPASDTPNRRPEGEGTAKGDASTTRGADVPAEVEKTLQDKADDFNERHKSKLGYGATIGQLRSVYQRGVGAYNVSHSPKVQSQQQWAYARVNAFLYLLKNGRPENPKYTQDNDLLPAKHPKAAK
jgi:capsid protein